MSRWLFWICLVMASIPAARAADSLDALMGERNEFLPVEQAYRVLPVVAGEVLQWRWQLEPGYYLYRDKFKLQQVGGGELPLQTPAGITKFDEYLGEEVPIFYQQVELTTPLTALEDGAQLKLTSQGCADAGLCYPPQHHYFRWDKAGAEAIAIDAPSLTGGVAPGGGLGNVLGSGNVLGNDSAGPGSLLFYLLIAAAGGALLNLMPCVFPVLSLKALSFASSENQREHRRQGLSYTAGVVLSFGLAAVAILVARAAGQGAGWGFQLQSPLFVGALFYLFLVMGLSLSGAVTLGTRLMGVGQSLTNSGGLRGSFFTGVLAALVASPCTGPLMAPALGFALTQSAPVAVAIFLALGLGMALPFLLLSFSPALARRLPRPGQWMVTFKELLAFPMYLTAAWLLYVFGNQVGMGKVFLLLTGAVAVAFALWLWPRLPQRGTGAWAGRAGVVAALLVALLAVYRAPQDSAAADRWEPYSAAALADYRAAGRPVLVDFTADWCLTCKANEAVALSGETFFAAAEHHGVTLMKADWTREDPEITAALAALNRSGVPLYAVYPGAAGAPPEILPQLLTPNLVLEALSRAAGTSIARD